MERPDSLVTRRANLKALGAGVTALTAGCLGGDDSDAGDENGSGIDEPITFASWGESALVENFENISKDFTEEYGIEAEVNQQTHGEAWHAWFQTKIQDDDLPHLIQSIPANLAPYLEYYRDGVEELMTEEQLSRYGDQILELTKTQEKRYQVPWLIGYELMYHRNDLMSEVGINELPSSTDGVFDAAESISEETDVEYGLSFINWSWGWMPFFWAEGINVLDDANENAAFNTARTVEILERMRELTEKGVIPSECWTERKSPQLDLFNERKTALHLGDTHELALILNNMDNVDEALGMSPAPGGAGKFNKIGFGIMNTHSSETQEASAKWTEVATREKHVRALLEKSATLPSTTNIVKDLMDDEEFKSNNPYLIKLWQVFFDKGDALVEPPAVQEALEIWDIMQSEFADAGLGNKPAQDAVDSAEKRVNSVLG